MPTKGFTLQIFRKYTTINAEILYFDLVLKRYEMLLAADTLHGSILCVHKCKTKYLLSPLAWPSDLCPIGRQVSGRGHLAWSSVTVPS